MQSKSGFAPLFDGSCTDQLVRTCCLVHPAFALGLSEVVQVTADDEEELGDRVQALRQKEAQRLQGIIARVSQEVQGSVTDLEQQTLALQGSCWEEEL